MKLTAKIALALLLVSLAPLGFFGAIALMLARENLVDQAEAQLRFAAARKRQQIEFLVESYHDRVRLVASRTQLRLSLRALIEREDPAAREQLTRILNDALPTIKGFETLSVTTMNGEVAASTDASLVGADWSGEAWFQSGRVEESSSFFSDGNLLKLRLTGPLLLDDQRIGIVVIRALANDLVSVLNLPIGNSITGETLLARRDSDGAARFIVSPRDMGKPPLSFIIPRNRREAPMSRALMKISATFPDTTDFRGVPVMAATEYLHDRDWGLVVQMDREEALLPARRLTAALVGAIGGTAGLVLLIALATARHLTRPVLALAKSAARIRSGDYQHRAQEERTDELGTLARSFNEMSAELIQLNTFLESRVAERTGELRDANEKLRASDERLRQFNRELEAKVRQRAGELALSEERYQLVVQGAVDGIWDWNVRTGECVYSDHWLEHLGYGAGEFPSRWEAWIERVHPEDAGEVEARLRKHLEAGGRFDVVCRVRSKDDDYRWFRVCGQAQWDHANRPTRMAGSHTDVTEHKQAEAALQQSQKLESLGVLAGGIAHDFNNILTAILGNISLARVEISPESEAQPMLAEIEKSAQRAADLCKQMLAYSGQGKFQVIAVDLSEIVADMENLLRVSITKNVLLTFHLAQRLPSVIADIAQLRQIVMNLVINASEAIGDRSGAISVCTGLTRATAEFLAETELPEGLEPGDYVALEVTDTGEGMAPEILARIFDPFFTTKFTGRGLGLAAILGIVRSHHGTLRVLSEPGKGTTFKILLPCSPAEPSRLNRAPLPKADRGEGLVLIVDDEETVRTTAARILERCGFTTLTATDGMDGVARFEEKADEIRLVMLDLTMPHMNGVEAFDRIKLIRPRTPVLLMSGFSEEAALQRFADQGLAGFVQKPFQFETLAKAAAAALNTANPDERAAV